MKVALHCTYVSGGKCNAWFDEVKLSHGSPAGASPGVARPSLLSSIDGPLAGTSDKVFFEYDAGGNPSASVDEIGWRTEILSVNAVGQPTVVRDPNDVLANLDYDSQNRLIGVAVNPGLSDEARTDIQYDAIGQAARIDFPGTPFLLFAYDDARRLTSVETALGERRAFAHDGLSRVTNVTERTAGGAVAMTHDFAFDELGRLLRSIGASGQTATYAHDRNDNTVSVTDPRSKLYAYGFDALDRVIRETDPDSAVTNLTRRSDGAVSAVEDAKTLVTSYVRNAWGEVTQTTSPDTGVTSYVRDARGLVSSMTRATGITTTYTYDGAGRLLSESFSSDPGATRTYTYDSTTPSGNRGVGRLASITDSSGVTTFAYDAHGNMTSTTRAIGGFNYSTSYAYADGDKAVSLTYPSGRIVTWSYGSSGNVTAIRMRANAGAPLEDVLTSVTHLAMTDSGSMGTEGEGGLWTVKAGTFGNGLQLAATYDQDGRLATLGAGAVQALTFGYDAASNVASMADGVTPSRSQIFQYDDLNRLTQAVGVYGTIGYAYDLVGNRTSKVSNATAETYAYPATSHRLSSVTGGAVNRSFGYAVSGQLASETKGGAALSYVYNGAGRMVEAQNGGVAFAAYAYDAFGQRVAKSTTAAAPGGASSVHFIHDEAGRLIAEHNGVTGAVMREYVWLGLQAVAYVDHSSGAPVTYYVHTDQVMNPQKLTNAAGAVVWDRVYEPFGEEISVSGALTEPLRFPGQTADAETQFFQNWNRDYDPSLGRYIQSDPIGLLGGINTYAYVGGNPLSAVDPMGLDWVYDQDTGDLTHHPMSFANPPPRMSDSDCSCSRAGGPNPDYFYEGGYSGAAGSVNLSSHQGIESSGPIPQGRYSIGRPRDSNSTGRFVMDLTPDRSNEMFSRRAFQIHGDNALRNRSASEGCVILPREVRNAIAESGDDRLWITGSAPHGYSPRTRPQLRE
ncbi:MAG: RHS repeat-associated core domain-containing protein [Parvularculaceae bacterium]